MRAATLWIILAPLLWCSEPVVIDFESAVPLGAEQKANRFSRWEEKGVVFTLAQAPKTTKGKGLLMFFTHLASGRKGLLSAMAQEAIPVRATFPVPVQSVTVTFWGSTNTPVRLEAFDSNGQRVDHASLPTLPQRRTAADPAPLVPLAVQAERIAWIEFSGPREGEYLAADEVRFVPSGSR